VIETTITAAISDPTCGIRSNSPTISASTTGKGAPMITAVKPTTDPAITEIAMLPSREKEIVRVTSSSSRSTRLASAGGSILSPARLKSGSPINRNSVRNESVTMLNTDPTSEPVSPSSADAAFGIAAAASAASFWALSTASVLSASCWNAGSSLRSSM
jgi:hypothetical protein